MLTIEGLPHVTVTGSADMLDVKNVHFKTAHEVWSGCF